MKQTGDLICDLGGLRNIQTTNRSISGKIRDIYKGCQVSVISL